MLGRIAAVGDRGAEGGRLQITNCTMIALITRPWMIRSVMCHDASEPKRRYPANSRQSRREMGIPHLARVHSHPDQG